MKTKPIIDVLLLALLVFAAYFAGLKLGQGQAHQRITDAWNEIFGEEDEVVATEMLADDVQRSFRQDPFDEDPFGLNDSNDPFANNLGPFLGDDGSGNGYDVTELFNANSTK